VTSATVTAPSAMKASASTVKAAASMKTAAEARLPAHGVASGHATVIKATERREARVEGAFAGVPERRMAKIVSERQRLGEILVKPQPPRQGPCDLRDFKRVGEPGAIMIAFIENENLGLMLEAPKGGGMDDAVAIAAERAAGLARRLAMKPAAA